MRNLSIHQFCSLRWPFFHDVVKYCNLGVDSIGLWRSKVSDFGFEEAADLLSEMNLNVSSLSWAGGFTGSDGSTFKLGIEDGLEAIYQAQMVGAERLIVHPGGRNRHTLTHAIRLVKTALRELVPLASDLGVQLVIEPVMDEWSVWNFMASPEIYGELLNEFSADDLGLVLDLFWLNTRSVFYSDLDSYADRISLVQIADRKKIGGEYVRCPLGQGEVQLEAWMNSLARIGYSGEFEVELHGQLFENLDYADVIRQSQASFTTTALKAFSGSVAN